MVLGSFAVVAEIAGSSAARGRRRAPLLLRAYRSCSPPLLVWCPKPTVSIVAAAAVGVGVMANKGVKAGVWVVEEEADVRATADAAAADDDDDDDTEAVGFCLVRLSSAT